METLIEPLLAALDEVISPNTIILRNDAPSRALEGLDTYVRAAKGEMPSRIAVEENGARYFADLAGGQKTGWYYDQRDNRAFMAKLAKGKTVLDAYCYTGGFGLLAAKAGADEVDRARQFRARACAGRRMRRARMPSRAKFIKCDVFEELERLSAETFDIVIADPPPFVKSKKDLEPGAKAYRKLARHGRKNHRAGRLPAARFVLAQHARGALRARNAPSASRARAAMRRSSINRARAPIIRSIRCCRKRRI